MSVESHRASASSGRLAAGVDGLPVPPVRVPDVADSIGICSLRKAEGIAIRRSAVRLYERNSISRSPGWNTSGGSEETATRPEQRYAYGEPPPTISLGLVVL